MHEEREDTRPSHRDRCADQRKHVCVGVGRYGTSITHTPGGSVENPFPVRLKFGRVASLGEVGQEDQSPPPPLDGSSGNNSTAVSHLVPPAQLCAFGDATLTGYKISGVAWGSRGRNNSSAVSSPCYLPQA